MKVSIVIAVYNEARTVATLLERVWEQPLTGFTKEIIVVESNSTDGTRRMVADFAARHAGDCTANIQVIFEESARGKGYAVRQALAAASGDVILIQDADLEYDVADYPRLLNPIREGRCAFVLGSRHMGPSRWRIRKFARSGLLPGLMNVGAIFFHAFFNAVFSTRLSDPTTMYKVFRADCLNGLTFTCNRFDFDYELLGKLIRAGFAPLEVPINYRSRGFQEGKKIRLFRDPPTWVAAIIRCRFASLGAADKSAAGKGVEGKGPRVYSDNPARRASS
jgi:glycosyltransferase involved in cell wall biosynthesis